MSDDPTDIGLPDVLDAHRAQILDGINTTQPGQIVEYDKATQRASVQPLVKKAHIDENGDEVLEAQPIVHNAIVMHSGPARGRITFPVKVGDTCLLFHASCSLATWSQTGGMVDPKDPRRHDISDSIAIVGLHDFGHVPTDAPDDAVVINAGAGVTIKLGDSSANKAVQNTDDGADFMAALAAAITALGADPAATALVALQTALGTLPVGAPHAGSSWPVGATKVTAK